MKIGDTEIENEIEEIRGRLAGDVAAYLVSIWEPSGRHGKNLNVAMALMEPALRMTVAGRFDGERDRLRRECADLDEIVEAVHVLAAEKMRALFIERGLSAEPAVASVSWWRRLNAGGGK
jgi:hypothetical protein